MNKALERPNNRFFYKQSQKRDPFEKWIRKVNKSRIEEIQQWAAECAKLAHENKPFKRPVLDNKFERQLFQRCLEDEEAWHLMKETKDDVFWVPTSDGGFYVKGEASEFEIREMVDRYS